MNELFNVKSIFFHVLGYGISYLEFFGVVAGLISIWLSARANILTWPIGLLNVILAFILYYQVQLYPDMFLQLFFFVTNVIGWWRWTHPDPGEEDKKKELKVSHMKRSHFILLWISGLLGAALLGTLAGRLHEWFPSVFPIASAYPYADSFIMVMSITTTFFVIQKKIESWIIWIVVDAIAVCLYYIKGIKFYSLEYLVFMIIAIIGLIHWLKEYKGYAPNRVSQK